MSVLLTINITDVEDAITLRENELLNAIFDGAFAVIQAGGRIIFKRDYENAPSDKLCEVSTRRELEDLKSQVNDSLDLLGSHNV